MKRVVLDTNIIISAIAFGGKPKTIMDMAIEGKVRIIVSEDILREVKEVLNGKKFHYPLEIIHSIIAELESLADFVMPMTRIDAVRSDPDDNRILECAVAASVDCIITGDTHLLELKNFEEITIITPDQFLRKY